MKTLYFVAPANAQYAQEEILSGDIEGHESLEKAQAELKIYSDLDQKDLKIWKITMEVMG